MALLKALQELLRPEIEQMSAARNNTVVPVQAPTMLGRMPSAMQRNPYETMRDNPGTPMPDMNWTEMQPGGGRFRLPEDSSVWDSGAGSFVPAPKPGPSSYDEEEKRLRRAMAFNTLRLEPDQGLANVLADRIKTASQIGRQNKTAQRVAIELQNQGRFKEAAMVEANPEIAKDMLVALMKPTKSFLTMSGAQANKMLNSDVFKPDQAVKYEQSTGEFSGIGSAGTNVTIVSPSDKRETRAQERWAEDLVDRTKQYQQAGQASNRLLQGVRNLQSRLEAIDQGPWAEREQKLRLFAASIGFPVDKVKLAEGQSAVAAGNAMVIEQLRMNKGPQTDFDAQFQTTILPSIGNEAEANRQITAYITSINLLDTIYGREASKVRGMEFDKGNAIILRLDELSTTVPAVAKIGDQWIQFSAYYNKSKALNPQASGMEIIEKWQKAIGQ